MQQTAHDFGEEFTLAKPHIFSSFYVDDCLAGADSPENAIKLQQQLRNLLQKGGFDLRKWKSNSQIVLDSIPATLHDPAQVKALTEGLSNAPQKTFGIVWTASNDCLYVSIGNHSTAASTKRSIISDVAHMFDILGRLSPCTITMKILFQRLWELKLEWDEEVPLHIQHQHQLWKEQLPLLKEVPFQRCYFKPDSVVLSTELHGFCDASKDAYAAAVYM